MSAAADWASVAVTLTLGMVGVVVALNIRRDMRLKVAERRLQAYERLWAVTSVTSPACEPLGENERKLLHTRLIAWYYENGDGLLLQNHSRTLYQTAKDNLVRPTADIVPTESRRRIQTVPENERDRQHGLLARRQFSLLRTQLRSELAVYGKPYGPLIDNEDAAFLRDCGISVREQPWKSARLSK